MDSPKYDHYSSYSTPEYLHAVLNNLPIYITCYLIYRMNHQSLRGAVLLIILLVGFYTYRRFASDHQIVSPWQREHPPAILTASVDPPWGGENLLPNIYDPDAADAQLVCPGYIASAVMQSDTKLSATLELAGPACNLYGNDVDRLHLRVEYQSADRLSVEILPTYIGPSNASYYILSPDLIMKPQAEEDVEKTAPKNDLAFGWGNEPSFWFSVTRKSTGDVLFSTEGRKIVYADQFIEFSSPLPEDYNLYGLGEVMHGLRLSSNFTRTTWNVDVGDPLDRNLYGTHPFYLETRYYKPNDNSGKSEYVPFGDVKEELIDKYSSRSHGVYLRNGHGQEVLLRPNGITWRILGGTIDLYFFAGPSPAEVTKAYQSGAIGLPALQQYYTFGYHQCRWGYRNWDELDEVIDAFEKFDIPVETIWSDIDYMMQYRDFTNDENNYGIANGQKFLKKLHAGGRHYVPIIDAAIYIPNANNDSDAYETFSRGKKVDAFLKNSDGSLYIGKVWPGYTVFPDWLSPGSNNWWVNEIESFHSRIPFDGIWIDMNEASSFCVGSCGTDQLSQNPLIHTQRGPDHIVYEYPEGFEVTNATEAASASARNAAIRASKISELPAMTTSSYYRTTPTPGTRNINHPPYVMDNVYGDLAAHAISPNATHHDGSVEYDRHNLFGHQILLATYNGLLKVSPKTRPFIIGRSTFAGSGRVAGHWGGDNQSKWLYMKLSIPQALSFALFGIPMFGVDACGFDGHTSSELCARWMQLAAFMPFMRNHNMIGAISQEPYRWASVAEAARNALQIRYKLLPYMYTLFHDAHTTGALVMRALAWEFPNDPRLAATDTTFLLGPALLVAPVLSPGATSVTFQLPRAIWYDWYSHRRALPTPSGLVTAHAPLSHIPLYLRGGHILATQESRLTTREARNTPWSIVVALDDAGTASGSLYLDDGASIAPPETLRVTLTAFRAPADNSTQAKGSGSGSGAKAKGRLSVSLAGSYPADTKVNALAQVKVLGVGAAQAISEVWFRGERVEPRQWSVHGELHGDAFISIDLLGGVKGEKRGAWDGEWVLEWW
ncbi:MAG: hypothetical protein M1829_002745 [Trizodia sp. TS-e1964]|nr:MAG: hypothetical protein M1829_002745 [Trizodia sp. TS-e1964]